ncbi:polybromodomain proteinidentical [Aphelenchoides avenae]|nr:polybromodomain proteinidentical [Aphelenchus avenae]
MCDYQFDSQDSLYEHIKTSHTCQPSCKVLVDGADHYACTWTSCTKYRKDGKHFFEYIPMAQNGTAAHPNSHSASKDKSIAGHFLHKPNGRTLPNAAPCTVTTLTRRHTTPTSRPVSARKATLSIIIANAQTRLHTAASRPGPPPTPSTSAARPAGTPVGVATTPGHNVIHQPGVGQVQKLVQDTLNGTTVSVPANHQDRRMSPVYLAETVAA